MFSSVLCIVVTYLFHIYFRASLSCIQHPRALSSRLVFIIMNTDSNSMETDGDRVMQMDETRWLRNNARRVLLCCGLGGPKCSRSGIALFGNSVQLNCCTLRHLEKDFAGVESALKRRVVTKCTTGFNNQLRCIFQSCLLYDSKCKQRLFP
jgi:hypothetical protein